MSLRHPRMTIAGPLLRGSGELHVVGRHEVMTVPDPDGLVHNLLGLADGSRSTAEIHDALAIHFPRLGAAELEHLVAELASIGLLEDCAPRARMIADRGAWQHPLQRMPFSGSVRAR